MVRYRLIQTRSTGTVSTCSPALLGLGAVLAAALLLAGCASWSGNVATSPTSLDFGNVLVGSSRNQSLTITNHGADAFTLTQAVASAEGFIVKAPALPVAIPGGQNATLTIRFAPTAIGGVAGSLLITRTRRATP